jgi:CRISPR-associated protein Cas5t
MAREYLETEEIPPPSTCYGFLLALVGEIDRRRHVGCRVTAALIGRPELSVVLRTVWRVKNRPLGASGNTRPDYQQLLSGIELVVWLDSAGEPPSDSTLESRVTDALDPARRGAIHRFGGLSLGESTHLVDSVSLLTPRLAHSIAERVRMDERRVFLEAARGDQAGVGAF